MSQRWLVIIAGQVAEPLGGHDAWLDTFGSVLVTFEAHDGTWFTRLVQYDDTTKIDFQIAPMSELEQASASRRLENPLDVARRTAASEIQPRSHALFATTALFRKTAVRVAGLLGYAYLHELDRRVTQYLERVRQLQASG